MAVGLQIDCHPEQLNTTARRPGAGQINYENFHFLNSYHGFLLFAVGVSSENSLHGAGKCSKPCKRHHRMTKDTTEDSNAGSIAHVDFADISLFYSQCGHHVFYRTSSCKVVGTLLVQRAARIHSEYFHVLSFRNF